MSSETREYSKKDLGRWYAAALKAHRWDIRDIAAGYRNVGIIMIVFGLASLGMEGSINWMLVAFGALQVYFGVLKFKTVKRLDRRLTIAQDSLGIDIDEVPDYNSHDVTGWFPD